MPSTAKERLQRTVAERNKAAGISSEASVSQTSNPEQLKCPPWDNSVSKARLDAAENCHRSLVEELMPLHYHEFLNEPKWSLRRKLTAISLSPSRQFQRTWRKMVEKFDLKEYFRRKELENLAKVRSISRPCGSQLEFTLPALTFGVYEEMPVGDRLLVHIFDELNTLAWLSVGAVCRRWHFIGRCTWNLTDYLELTESKADVPRLTSVESSLRLSKITYRFCLLTTLVLAGNICVNVEHLTLGRDVAFSLLDVLVFCSVRFVSSQMSISGVNDKVQNFVKDAVDLEELVLVNVEVCSVDNRRKRRELRSLDLRWNLAETSSKKHPRTNVPQLVISLDAFHRHNKNSFAKFCQELKTLNAQGVMFYGSALTNSSIGLSHSIFTQCFADLMPQLHELLLCNVVFADGTRLKISSLDELAKKIRRDSKLTTFCLIDGEISENAICNLQRCANLQIIILLRCEIVSEDPELRLLVGWHPAINHAGLLITDRQTILRRFKPVYFRVLRIANITDLKKVNAALDRKSWTITALLNAAVLGVSGLSPGSPPECEAEDVLMDACWFQ